MYTLFSVRCLKNTFFFLNSRALIMTSVTQSTVETTQSLLFFSMILFFSKLILRTSKHLLHKKPAGYIRIHVNYSHTQPRRSIHSFIQTPRSQQPLGLGPISEATVHHPSTASTRLRGRLQLVAQQRVPIVGRRQLHECRVWRRRLLLRTLPAVVGDLVGIVAGAVVEVPVREKGSLKK